MFFGPIDAMTEQSISRTMTMAEPKSDRRGERHRVMVR